MADRVGNGILADEIFKLQKVGFDSSFAGFIN